VKTIRSIEEMTEFSERQRAAGGSLGFVPTMGSLHDGHLSLVRRAKGENTATVVSIFVNPSQFAPSEDFQRYPRDLEGDSSKLSDLKVDALFCPEADEMYPPGHMTYVHVDVLSEKLCGRFRPDHFRGVATVVAKLFEIVRPTRAYFGQKDYQQWRIVTSLSRDLNMGIDIIICPTVRERDGLAMSSRNAYLGAEERHAASVIFRALREASDLVRRTRSAKGVAAEFQALFAREPLITEVQYAGAFDPLTLSELKDDTIDGRVLLAVALKLGDTRLIDNELVDVV